MPDEKFTNILKILLDINSAMKYNKIYRFGEMAEWLKAPVLKTGDVERHRGFESLSLRQLLRLWRSTQVAEGAPLLRE